MKIWVGVFTFFLLFQSIVAEAQYYNINFKKLTVNEGMPADDVECIFQDSQGYIWIGTRFGLSVFDGQRFRNFQFDPNDPKSLGGSRVFQITEDKDGALWMAIENFGLSKLNRRTFTFENFCIPIKNAPEDRYINTLLIENDRRIWIGTENGISVFDPVSKTYQAEKIQNPPSSGVEVISIKKDSSGVIWAATYNGEIFYKDKKIGAFRSIPRSSSTGFVYQLYEKDKSSFLVATEKGVFSVINKTDPSKSSLQKLPFYGENESISALTQDLSGNWWVAGTGKGVQVYFPGSGFVQNLNSTWYAVLNPGNTNWKAILRDRDGGIWLGGEQGLFYHNQQYNQFKQYPSILKYADQYALGKIIGISTYGEKIVSVAVKGISVYDRTKAAFYPVQISPGLKGLKIVYNSISDLGPGLWWLATTVGILELRVRGNSFVLDRPAELMHHPVLSTHQVYSIAYDQKDDFWFCTPDHGLIHFDRNKTKFNIITSFGKNKFRQELVHLDYVHATKNDEVIVGHHSGFAIQYPGTGAFQQIQELVDTSFDFSNLSVYDIVANGGYWWLATEGHGLLRFDATKKALNFFGIESGIASNSITSILALDEKTMAVGTSRGLSILDIPSSTFNNYFRKDGLPSEQFVIGAHHKSPDGEIFFVTSAGMISFNKKELRHSKVKSTIKLYALVKNNELMSDSAVSTVVEKAEIVLGHTESLTLMFSSLNYSNDNDFVLRYRLSPEDPWKISQSPLQLSLVNINPGSYKLVVQLMNKAGGVMSDRMVFTLEVIPPFWKTPIFRLIILMASLLVLWFILKSTFQKRLDEQKRTLEKQNLLQQERLRIAMDLHDDIGGNLTAMNLMTSILKDIDIDAKGKMIISKIREASERMIQDMDEIIWALNISNDKLPQLMSYVRQYIASSLAVAGIDFEIEEPDNYPDLHVSGRYRRNIFMIMKQLLNNAIKHSGTKKISLKIVLDKRIRIWFSDNGEGLQQDMSTLTTGGGNGINNLLKRAAEMGATVQFINEKGLTIVFDMPLKNFDNKQ